MVEGESAWVEAEFLRLVDPVEGQFAAGRFPPLGDLVELAHAPYPVFARVLPWRVDPHRMRRTVGLALHTLRLFAPRSVSRLDWLLSPDGWLDCYDLEDGRLVLAASAAPAEAEQRALELVRAAERITRGEGRRVDAAELLVVVGPAAPRSRLESLPTRFLTGDGPARFTLSLVRAGLADRQLVARQPGAGVETTSLHPETAARLGLPFASGHELEDQDPEEGVYCFCRRAPQASRIVVADSRGRAPREDGRHGIHSGALRRSVDRALATLGPADGSEGVHRIRVVLDAGVDVDLHAMVDPLESLVPVARRRGVGRIELVTGQGRAGGRTLVGSIDDHRESQSVHWCWVAPQAPQSHGTRLRSS